MALASDGVGLEASGPDELGLQRDRGRINRGSVEFRRVAAHLRPVLASLCLPNVKIRPTLAMTPNMELKTGPILKNILGRRALLVRYPDVDGLPTNAPSSKPLIRKLVQRLTMETIVTIAVEKCGHLMLKAALETRVNWTSLAGAAPTGRVERRHRACPSNKKQHAQASEVSHASCIHQDAQ